MKYIYKLKDFASKNKLGKHLNYRPMGKMAKEEVLLILDRMLNSESLEMDFSGIELCDISFADELLIETKLFLKEKENIIFFITNFNKDIKDSIEGTIALREKKDNIKVTILTKERGIYSKVGSSLEKNLEETFDYLIEKRKITARGVAEKFSLEINSSSNRLKKLFDTGLVLREELVDTNGRQHIYYLP